MEDLNKLTFSGFLESPREMTEGGWGGIFFSWRDVMNTDNMILDGMHSVFVQPTSKHELV